MTTEKTIIDLFPLLSRPDWPSPPISADATIAVCNRCAKFEAEHPDAKQGICRAHPPTPLLVGHVPAATSFTHPQPVVQSFQPPTSAGGWCWEFEARATVAVAPPASRVDLLRIPTDDDAA